jgi:glutathione S-transferase
MTMILIGQYDSSYTRRVAIALDLYRIPFEHRPWSVFGDAERLSALNPAVRVPTLVLDDGTVLTDSHAMIDYLDSLVPEDSAMFPRREPDRHHALRIDAFAIAFVEKAGSLFYERALHREVSADWVARCTGQVHGILRMLETERAAQTTPFWFGDRISHADIAVVCGLRHADDANPGLIGWQNYPALRGLFDRLEGTEVFQRISQVFIPPT